MGVLIDVDPFLSLHCHDTKFWRFEEIKPKKNDVCVESNPERTEKEVKCLTTHNYFFEPQRRHYPLAKCLDGLACLVS